MDYRELKVNLGKLAVKKRDLERELKAITSELTPLKDALAKVMEEDGLDKEMLPEFGSITLTKKFGITVPKTIEDMKALTRDLRERGHTDDFILGLFRVDSAALNDFFEQEREACSLRGVNVKPLAGCGPPALQVFVRLNPSRS